MHTNFKRWSLSMLVVTSIALASCGGSGKDPEMKMASVDLMALGDSTVAGSLTFIEDEGGVMITGMVTGLMPNAQHGFHIHEVGNCGDSTAADGTITMGGAAGGHWNPGAHMHGEPDMESHLGDLGNLTADENGVANVQITKAGITIGDLSMMDVIGRSVIVHAKRDDLMSQPTGDAGARWGCGIVK